MRYKHDRVVCPCCSTIIYLGSKKLILEKLENQELTWKELLEKTGLSKGALSKHLNELLWGRIILTKPSKERPFRSIYYINNK